MPQRFTSPWWDNTATPDENGLTLRVKTRVNSSYPVIDARTGGPHAERGKPWNTVLHRRTSGLDTRIREIRWFFFWVVARVEEARFPRYTYAETDQWLDGRMCYLDDEGVWLAQGRRNWNTTDLTGASFHPWGEWDDEMIGGDVASAIPSWGMVDPNWRTAAAIGLPAWAIESNTYVSPATFTDVRNPDPGGDNRGAAPGQGFPMGSRLVITEATLNNALATIETLTGPHGALTPEAAKAEEIITDLRTYGGLLMNTTGDLHGSINRIDLDEETEVLIESCLANAEWQTATIDW